MTFKTFLSSLMVAAVLLTPAAFATAAEPVVSPSENVLVSEISNPVIVVDEQVVELAALKLKEKDPSIGGITKFFLRLKIRQLENQLNIKKALN